MTDKMEEFDAKIDSFDTMLTDAFYDIGLNDGHTGLPGYPKIMLNIYNRFMEKKRREALQRGEEFDKEALFDKKFNEEEHKTIREVQVEDQVKA